MDLSHFCMSCDGGLVCSSSELSFEGCLYDEQPLKGRISISHEQREGLFTLQRNTRVPFW